MVTSTRWPVARARQSLAKREPDDRLLAEDIGDGGLPVRLGNPRGRSAVLLALVCTLIITRANGAGLAKEIVRGRISSERGLVERTGKSQGQLYFYRVDPDGELVGSPLVIAPPDEGPWEGTSSNHPNIAWNGSAYFAVWRVAHETEGQRLFVTKILKDGTLDAEWGDGGSFEPLPEFSSVLAPQLALHCGGATAALVWGTSSFGLAIMNLNEPRVLAHTESDSCSSPEGGNNNNGHRVVFNRRLNEFGMVFSTAGDGDPASSEEVLSALLRWDLEGNTKGSAVPLHCAAYTGAGHAAGLSVDGAGNYMVGMSTGAVCEEEVCPASVELIAYDPVGDSVLRTLTAPAKGAYDQPQVLSTSDKTFLVGGNSSPNGHLIVYSN